MKEMKLTPMSNEIFTYLKENGGKISVDEICEAVGRVPRSVNANVTDLQKKGLVIREKVDGEGEDAKKITYVVLTDAGNDFENPQE